MGEVIRFITKSERERGRLIREARAIYESIFPPSDPVSERRDTAPLRHCQCLSQRRGFASMIRIIGGLCGVSSPADCQLAPRS
jgi:hypothetical protein